VDTVPIPTSPVERIVILAVAADPFEKVRLLVEVAVIRATSTPAQ
jgi:hypothetical protein